MFKKLFILLISVIGCGFGIALTVKASIGVAPYDAVSVGISELTSMKTGDIVVLLNLFLMVVQFIMKGKEFKPFQLLQLVISVVLGWSINLFLYTVLANVELTSYVVRFVWLLAGQVICAWFVCISLVLRVISFPLESTCLVISDKFNYSLGKVRQWADIAFVVVSLLFTFVLQCDLVIREGSLISLIIFGPLLDLFRPSIVSLLKKVNI